MAGTFIEHPRRIVRLCIIIAAALSASGCWSSEPVGERVHSNAGVSAWVTRSSGGATTSFLYEVWMECSSVERVAAVYGPTDEAGRYDLEIQWRSDTLAILYFEAQRIEAAQDSVRCGGQTLLVRIHSGNGRSQEARSP